MLRKPFLWTAALALVAVLGLTAQASASTVKGTVVHSNKSAHTFVVAGRKGRLTVLSARHVARTGSVVRVSARKTKNGLRVRKMHVRGHAKHARLRGLVTWASKSGFTVASNGASLLVRKSGSDDGAPVGTPVQTNVTIDDQGDLEDDNTQQTGDVPAQMKLEGVVLSTDPSAETITISGDDDSAEAQSSDDGGDQGLSPQIVVHVPDATAFTVGDKVELIVTGPASDGSFTLVKVDEQESQSGEDGGDTNSGQGDLGGDGSGDGSGNTGSGDGSGGGS
ncbi:MAG TPA: hypothetical protein VF032_16310 [Thermoleophilaceae bacterium]